MPRPKHARRGSRFLTRFMVLVVLMMVLAYPLYEAYHLTVENVTLEIEGLPQDLNNITIVYLSDIHYAAFYPMYMVENLVNKVNALNPDIILLGGDYAIDSDTAIEFFKTAPQFRAKYQVAAALGNHDRTLPESNLALLQSAMYNANVIPLVNNTLRINIGGSSMVLAGIDDINNGHPDIQAVASQVTESDFVIFLSHSPDAVSGAFTYQSKDGSNRWFDLMLCGHTHGGQVTLFGRSLIQSIANTQSDYLSGWYKENRVPILVSNGVGTSVVPIRLFAPAQIHLITLKAA